jgi:hypothetical protein
VVLGVFGVFGAFAGLVFVEAIKFGGKGSAPRTPR